MTRIFGHMVMRNESEKWLESSLAWNTKFFDGFHVYDDRSTDNSVQVASKYVSEVTVRDESVPSFIEDESKFRQAAWFDMQEVLELQKDDWVLSIDADEFLVGNLKENDPRVGLEMLIKFAEETKKVSVCIRKPDLWSLNPPQARVDGWWNKDCPPRMAKWKPKGEFKNVKLGCGSVPAYGLRGPVKNLHTVSILHFGYAIEGQNELKYDLYSQVSDNAHTKGHLDSLLTTPKLKEYQGPMPNYWRGTQ